jgi:glycosyltransferase involved in cell wall biosynthesis
MDSLLGQTYTNLEVIIVDDHSQDGTPEILRKYAGAHPNIRLFFNEHNIGFNANFEKGLRLAQGEYIAISDQDDIWRPDKIAFLLNCIGDGLLVYSDSILIDRDGNPVGRNNLHRKRLYVGGDPRAFILVNNVSGHSVLLKRTLLDIAFPLPPHCVYDWWLGLVATNEKKIRATKEALTYYRQHNNNTSVVLWNKRLQLLFLRDWTKDILTLEGLQHRSFFEKLHVLIRQHTRHYWDLRLLFFLVAHWKILTCNTDRKALSRLNIVRKICI